MFRRLFRRRATGTVRPPTTHARRFASQPHANHPRLTAPPFTRIGCGDTLHVDAAKRVRYEILTPERSAESSALIARAMSKNEPTSAILDEQFPDWLQVTDLFAQRAASNGLSIGCLDSTSGRLLGVMWNNDFADDLPAAAKPVLDESKSAFVLELIDKLEMAHFLKFGINLAAGDKVPRGLYFHGFMLSTDPDRHRSGLGFDLFRLSTQLGLNRGFTRFLSEPSGAHSASIMSRCGWTCSGRIRYADAEFGAERKRPLAAVPHPHTHLSLFEYDAAWRHPLYQTPQKPQ